jgi:hypothetical protein
MKTISVLLLIAGLILAPAYWIYAKFYTGKQTAMLTLAKVESSDKSNPNWRSPPFELQADMAPVGLVLHVNASFTPNMDEHKPPHDRYNIILSREGEIAKPLLINLKTSSTSNSNPAFKEHLLFMQAVQAGAYQLEVAPASVPSMKVDQMRLEIRQNLREPDSNIVTGGIVLLVLGLLGLIAI